MRCQYSKVFRGGCNLDETGSRSKKPPIGTECHERSKTCGHDTLRGALRALSHALVWLVFAAAQLVHRPTFALDLAAKPNRPFVAPLPPIRPAGPGGERATTDFPSAPAISAAPIEAARPQREPAAAPRNLPPASRARMHACGLEWQEMKKTGAAADKTWFDFALVCLAK
jgi:hypothetical protein